MDQLPPITPPGNRVNNNLSDIPPIAEMPDSPDPDNTRQKVLIAIIFFILVGLAAYGLILYKNNNSAVKDGNIVQPTPTSTIDPNLDSDNDGIPDAVEKVIGTSLAKKDTDGDAYDDLAEIKSGYSPLIAGSAGKLTPDQLQILKDKIKSADEKFYEKVFGSDILSLIKDNIEKVKNIHSVKNTKNYTKIFKGELFEESSSVDNYDFISPDKKHFLSSKNGESVIIGNDVYINHPAFGWLYGKDGQVVSPSNGRSMGDVISFDVKSYPSPWEFTSEAKGLGKDLGVIESSGIKCHNYEVGSAEAFSSEKKASEGGASLTKNGDEIRFLKDGKEFLFSVSKLVSMPVASLEISYRTLNNTNFYRLTVKSKGGNICVDEQTFWVYKENYIDEESVVDFYFDSGKNQNVYEDPLYFKHVFEVSYSDFNKEMKIEPPKGNVTTVEEFKKKMGLN